MSGPTPPPNDDAPLAARRPAGRSASVPRRAESNDYAAFFRLLTFTSGSSAVAALSPDVA